MKKFAFKMPVAKSLSYTFARVCRRDVLCSRLGVNVRPVDVHAEFGRGTIGTMNRYGFTWYEMRPVKGEDNLYVVSKCTYDRNGWGSVTGDRTFSESAYRRTTVSETAGVYFTREEAIGLLRDLERKMLEQKSTYIVEAAPASLRALNVHRCTAVKAAANS